MSLLAELWAELTTAAHWWGPDGFAGRTGEHALMSLEVVALAVLVAVPPAVVLGHTGRGAFTAVGVANLGRAIPTFAVVAILFGPFIRLGIGDLGYWPTFIGLFALALPPIFTNAFTGVREVDRATVDAARGMGMRPRQVLTRIELPLATPVMLAALRVSAVQVVATATIGAIFGWGGLGVYIVRGFAQRDFAQAAAGTLLVMVLAIATDALVGGAERALPTGIRRLRPGRERAGTAQPA